LEVEDEPIDEIFELRLVELVNTLSSFVVASFLAMSAHA
jgi:hypothetical protein